MRGDLDHSIDFAHRIRIRQYPILIVDRHSSGTVFNWQIVMDIIVCFLWSEVPSISSILHEVYQLRPAYRVIDRFDCRIVRARRINIGAQVAIVQVVHTKWHYVQDTFRRIGRELIYIVYDRGFWYHGSARCVNINFSAGINNSHRTLEAGWGYSNMSVPSTIYSG